MAENGSIDCPCSNITIMQLFHELKQRYPTVPDQIVSKVIQENCHDKNACEVILKRENRTFLQTYPGALISGDSREFPKSLCNQCPGFKVSSSTDLKTTNSTGSPTKEKSLALSESSCIYLRKTKTGTNASSNRSQHAKKGKPRLKDLADVTSAAEEKSVPDGSQAENCCITQEKANCDKTEELKRFQSDDSDETFSRPSPSSKGTETNDLNSTSSSRTYCSDCDSETKSECSERYHFCDLSKGAGHPEMSTATWGEDETDDNSAGTSCGQMSVHNYQVAVQYSTQPSRPVRQVGQQRSSTTVNFTIRAPSSEPQAPIEIHSGQNLTYTSMVYDAKNGVQSQFQIMIGPALIEKQRKRKNLLAWELRKEQDKLQHMQNEVRLMKASIARKPSPHLLPKLKTEIEKLRAECEKLTAAVDMYSDSQNVLPLGETDEEFYRNIYTGQREGTWKCKMCTFRNHALLNVCEECGMPRFSLGTKVTDVASPLSNVLFNNNTSFRTVNLP